MNYLHRSGGVICLVSIATKTLLKVWKWFFSRFQRTRSTKRIFSRTNRSRVSLKKGLIAGGITLGISLTSLAITSAGSEVPPQGIPGSSKERTFIAVKPDGVQRSIVGEIIQRFERKGYKLVAIKMVVPTSDFAAKHYDDLKAKPFFGGLVKYFSSGPVVAMVWEGKNVIKGGRKLVGATNPNDAEPGSIRGDLCIEVGRNIIHGSDSPEAAEHEITLWFNAKEVTSYDMSVVPWVYDKI